MTLVSTLLALLLVQVPQEKASITGYILKMGSGEPVSKAEVTLSAFNGGKATSYTATTATSGQFSFQNLDPGQYRLSATRSGFVRMEYGARLPARPGLPITLNPGQRLTDIVVQIMQAGTISGRVFDRDGEPLANVTVEALKHGVQEGQGVLNVVQTTRTNDLGEYRLFWLQPGPYFVSASRAGANPADQAEGYVPVYYPGTTDAQSAAPIALGAGSLFSGVDLTLATVHTLRVQGQVINGVTGQPATNANVILAQSKIGRNSGNQASRINSQGQFEIRGVAPGSYDLQAIATNPGDRMTARMRIEVGNSDIQNISLILMPGLTVPGTLRVEGQVSAADRDMTRMRVMLRPTSPQIGGANPVSAMSPNGTFTIGQVARDDYRLTVSGMPPNAYIKSARIGAADVLNEGFPVDRQPDGPLEILISTNTGIADGAVQNDKGDPAVNVTVVLIPDGPRRSRLDLYRTTSTDAAGKFHIEGVAPGDYKVFSWEDVDLGVWQDPDFLRTFEERGRPIRINENGVSNIELRVIPPQA
jgi:hypothetical protein